MMTHDDISTFASQISKIEWEDATDISREACELVKEHLKRLQNALYCIMKDRRMSASGAYQFVTEVGPAFEGSGRLLDKLFADSNLHHSRVREHTILVLCNAFYWNQQHDLANHANPWEPLIALYTLGFVTCMEEDSMGTPTELCVYFNGKERRFPLLLHGGE